MEIEQAIKTAIDYETKVRDVYAQAAEQASSKAGKKAFQTLAKEEQYHLNYLNKRLHEWQETGALVVEKLASVVPPKEEIDKNISQLQAQVKPEDHEDEIQLLKKALEVEEATSDFYRKMVSELNSDAQAMFHEFLKAEEGHRNIVLAEIDCLSGMGFWFEFQEFDLEGA